VTGEQGTTVPATPGGSQVPRAPWSPVPKSLQS
jgi:hypothetical protein